MAESKGNQQPADDLREYVQQIVGDVELGNFTINEDRTSLHARVWVDGMPFLQVFERAPDEKDFKLVTMRALGQNKF